MYELGLEWLAEPTGIFYSICNKFCSRNKYTTENCS